MCSRNASRRGHGPFHTVNRGDNRVSGHDKGTVVESLHLTRCKYATCRGSVNRNISPCQIELVCSGWRSKIAEKKALSSQAAQHSPCLQSERAAVAFCYRSRRFGLLKGRILQHVGHTLTAVGDTGQSRVLRHHVTVCHTAPLSRRSITEHVINLVFLI